MTSFQMLITSQSKSNLLLSSFGKKANIILVHFISLIVTYHVIDSVRRRAYKDVIMLTNTAALSVQMTWLHLMS